MTRNKLYSLLLIACFAGLIYLFFVISQAQEGDFSVCIIKNITGYPCPSCGTSRAVVALMHGKIVESFLLNPFGIIVAIIMAVFPIWVLSDIALKRDSFFRWYKKAEAVIRKRWVGLILIVLVLINWIWNIYKHL